MGGFLGAMCLMTLQDLDSFRVLRARTKEIIRVYLIYCKGDYVGSLLSPTNSRSQENLGGLR